MTMSRRWARKKTTLDLSAPRPVLVVWVYNDGDSNAFVERVLATPEQEVYLRHRLAKLTNDQKWRGAIYDLYVGPEQSVPTPFESFRDVLDSNPYIAEYEAATAAAHRGRDGKG